MRTVFILVCFVVLSGCSFLNIFKGPDDFARHYAAGVIKEGIDNAIQEEVRKDVPSGYKSKPYSREVWNAYWNSRVFQLQDLGHNKTYRGPSGPEFIRYILETRKTNGLPDLVIEERNRDKIP